MNIAPEKKSLGALFLLAAGGAAAGFVNGFLGAGGGIILLALLTAANRSKGGDAPRDNFASVVAAVLPLCVVSAVSYGSRGSVDMATLSRYIIPGAAGGVLGAYLTDRVNTLFLKNIFAAVMVIAGINMLF